ncbi:hypothetical protein O6H91_04G028600 [Diphasiastrum complanatum]|uniref:Uncharacterized protein n=2 Tax=Diphasiastrum complanatum TaxID=34168 RepID=A0ACC2DVJ0_DIPCM|nr:hypothetical protein O6H91_04G026900 [Diphasiastrum complanatum]KAJ7558212.1 hypothetical protein O6H91_04G028600 [Diphasiastrum complanatum]
MAGAAAEAEKSPFEKELLAGKVALVTGGGSGICFEVARQFGLHGASVVLMGRRPDVLQTAAESLRKESIQVEHVQGDVRSADDATRAVEFVIESFGKIDILVNGAAGNFLSPAEGLSSNAFKTVIEIDTIGTFNMCKAAFPGLRRGGKGRDGADGEGGVIINITATLHYGATWYQSHASAAKAAVDSLTRSLSLEWGPDYGIRTAGIAPGPIANTIGMQKLGALVSEEDRLKNIPLRRMGKTWDIAMAALFLASRAGSWISGETLVVDGGHWLSKPQAFPRDAVTQASRRVEKISREVGASDKGENP